MAIMIEDKPLSVEQVQTIINVLQQTNFPGHFAASYIAMILALERITQGVDCVRSCEPDVKDPGVKEA